MKNTKVDKLKNIVSGQRTLVGVLAFYTLGLAASIVINNSKGQIKYYPGDSLEAFTIDQVDSVDIYQNMAKEIAFGINSESRCYIGRVATSDIDTFYSENISGFSVQGKFHEFNILKFDFTEKQISEFKKINQAKVYLLNGDSNE